MVINIKASKMQRLVEVLVVEKVFGKVVFVGIVLIEVIFVSSIISSHIATESPIRLAYLRFLQLHNAEFKK